MLKEKLLECDPINLSRLVVDLRERHNEYWAPFSDTHPQTLLLSSMVCPSLLQRGPWSHICHLSFPSTSRCLL